MFTTVKVR